MNNKDVDDIKELLYMQLQAQHVLNDYFLGNPDLAKVNHTISKERTTIMVKTFLEESLQKEKGAST